LTAALANALNAGDGIGRTKRSNRFVRTFRASASGAFSCVVGVERAIFSATQTEREQNFKNDGGERSALDASANV
jgi:hypothetical protein